jgi:hypothetical protein
MTKAFDEHGELSNRYKDLWAKKNLIAYKLISNMSFESENDDARWKILGEIGDELEQLSHPFIDLLAEHLQIPPNVFTEVKKKAKCS